MAIITKDLENGEKRYIAIIRVNGKQKWKRFRKKKHAEAYIHKSSVDLNEHTYRELIPGTFEQYASRWRKKYLTDSELKPSTLNGYNTNLDRHLIPAFGPKPLAAISSADVTDLRAAMQRGKEGQKALSPNSIKNSMNLLNRFFADAIEDNYLKVSPMPQRRRKGQSGKPARRGRALQPAEAQRLLAECEADPDEGRRANPKLRLVILIGLLAGLRRAEIFALQWSDLDFEKDLIHVRRSIFWRHGKHFDLPEGEASFVIHEPKSEAGKRTVDLSPTLKKELRARYLQSKDKSGLVFQSKEGTPLDPQNCYQRWFVPAVKRAVKKATEEKDHDAAKALDGLHVHDLRHTFGSMKISQGEDVVYVSKQLGHSKPSITFDVYAHLLKQHRPEAAKKTDDFLFGKKALAATE